MITFSIVTITYNAADVFPPTADSVMMQKYPYVEHLIVDGASQDETVRLANDYKLRSDKAGNGHEISILSESDKGIYDAMNKGLQRVSGDYVLFLNAGDRLPDGETLAHVAQVAELSGDGDVPAVLYGDTDIVDAEGRFLSHRRLSPPERLTWRSFRHGMLVCHQAFYVRADIAKRLSYNLKYRYSADVDWCIRVMKEAKRKQLSLRNVHAVVAHYMQEGQTTQHHQESLRERFRVMSHHYGLIPTAFMHAWFAVRSLIKH